MSMIKFDDKGDRNGAGVLFEPTVDRRFRVEMFGWGFEAYRYLNADDLREIRDWINREMGEDNA